MSNTAAHIISEKGGSAIVAAAVGKTPGAVRVWKHRNLFPRDVWPELMQAYPDVTLDVLIEAERIGASTSDGPQEPTPATSEAAA